MSKNIEKEFFKEVMKGINVDNPYNKNDLPPWSLYCPHDDGNTIWICDTDSETPNGYLSIFKHKGEIQDDTPDKVCATIDLSSAIFYRNELLDNGWRPLEPPKMQFRQPDANKTTEKLNRRQRRAMARKLITETRKKK